MILDNEQFILIQEAAWVSESGKLRSYSGRGMYGKQCLGFEYSDFSDAILFIGHAIQAFPDEWELMFRRTSQDSMGLGAIMYWPDIQINEKDQDFLDEAEDDEDYD